MINPPLPFNETTGHSWDWWAEAITDAVNSLNAKHQSDAFVIKDTGRGDVNKKDQLRAELDSFDSCPLVSEERKSPCCGIRIEMKYRIVAGDGWEYCPKCKRLLKYLTKEEVEKWGNPAPHPTEPYGVASSCCSRELIPQSSDEGTGYYTCGECGKPCDIKKVYITKPTEPKSDTKLIKCHNCDEVIGVIKDDPKHNEGWEYLVLFESELTERGGLPALGEEGWELCAVMDEDEDYEAKYFFKRSK